MPGIVLVVFLPEIFDLVANCRRVLLVFLALKFFFSRAFFALTFPATKRRVQGSSVDGSNNPTSKNYSLDSRMDLANPTSGAALLRSFDDSSEFFIILAAMFLDILSTVPNTEVSKM